jgi:hypothetical protein
LALSWVSGGYGTALGSGSGCGMRAAVGLFVAFAIVLSLTGCASRPPRCGGVANPIGLCNGDCPRDQLCVAAAVTNQCVCRGPAPALPCRNATYPECYGECGLGYACKASDGYCVCAFNSPFPDPHPPPLPEP